MSISAAHAEPAKASPDTRILLAIVWSATVAAQLLAAFGRGDTLLSTDDAMRLAEVRDFLAGQGWFDLTQNRLDPPGGVAMHWSRLVDLPLALLIRAGEVALAPPLAERAVLVLWPAMLLLGFLAGGARLARELGGEAAARLALLFAALSAPVLQHFRPGAIDHHNVQLVLLMWSLALAAPLAARQAVLAGLLAALSLTVGVELAPAIAALAAAVALRRVAAGAPARSATIAFGMSFAAATAMLFAATVPPSRYGAPACDALSVVHVAAAALGGLGLAALAALPALAAARTRLAAAGALALLLGALLGGAFPACMGDPYGHLDPRLNALWLAYVNEARSLSALLRDLPQEVPAYYGPPAAAFVFGVLACRRDNSTIRGRWIVALAVLAILFAVSLWQMRGTAAANAVAAAVLPAALLRRCPSDRPVFLGFGRAALTGALLLNPVAMIAIGSAGARALDVLGVAPRPTLISGGPAACVAASDYAPLARLPKGRVLGFIDAGPFLISETPHAAFAAPYHRNAAGNTAALDLWLGPAAAAQARLAALDVGYIAFCPGAPERYNYAAAAPQGLAAALGRGEVPDFLERVPLTGTSLMLFRVGR
jgi:hypothetical protein